MKGELKSLWIGFVVLLYLGGSWLATGLIALKTTEATGWAAVLLGVITILGVIVSLLILWLVGDLIKNAIAPATEDEE